jgi:phosphatidylglycerol:prolipoprotein diacylglycerol transferase
MLPDIHLFGSMYIHSYSLFILLAIIAASVTTYIGAKQYNHKTEDIFSALFWCILAGIIGAKLLEVVFYDWNAFINNPANTLLSGSGWMFYGAELGGYVGLATFLYFKKIPVARSFDIGTYGLALAHAIGRVGCFFAGCCYGVCTSSPIGVHFPHVNGYVHPTQLYEAIPLFVFFIITWIYRKRISGNGTVIGLYMVIYGIIRFIVETYREDAYTFGFLHLSPSQYIAASLFIIGSIILGKLFFSGKLLVENSK